MVGTTISHYKIWELYTKLPKTNPSHLFLRDLGRSIQRGLTG